MLEHIASIAVVVSDNVALWLITYVRPALEACYPALIDDKRSHSLSVFWRERVLAWMHRLSSLLFFIVYADERQGETPGLKAEEKKKKEKKDNKRIEWSRNK